VTVEGAIDAEGPAEVARSAHQLVVRAARATLTHHLHTVDRRRGTHEDRGRITYLVGDGVQAPVHTVDEIDVRQPGPAEHDVVARGAAESLRGVARLVVRPHVRLRLHDLGYREALIGFADYAAAQEVTRHLLCG